MLISSTLIFLLTADSGSVSSSPKSWSFSIRIRRHPSPSVNLSEMRMVRKISQIVRISWSSSYHSFHPAIHPARRHQRCSYGASDHDQRMQDCVCTSNHCRSAQLSVCTPGQEGQVSCAHHRQIDGEHAPNCWLQPCDHYGPPRQSNPGLLQRTRGQSLCGAQHIEVDPREPGRKELCHCQSRCWWCKEVRISCPWGTLCETCLFDRGEDAAHAYTATEVVTWLECSPGHCLHYFRSRNANDGAEQLPSLMVSTCPLR
jgi:hypothetical protein